MIEIFTDGAYSSSRNQGGWAFVVTQNNNKVHSSFDVVKNTTNNRMELQSAIEACKWAKENNISNFTLFSDSMYVIGTMTLNWKRKKNVDLWKQMDSVVTGLDINWKHVKGHNGDKWNSYCDMLAVHASHLLINSEECQEKNN